MSGVNYPKVVDLLADAIKELNRPCVAEAPAERKQDAAVGLRGLLHALEGRGGGVAGAGAAAAAADAAAEHTADSPTPPPPPTRGVIQPKGRKGPAGSGLFAGSALF